MAIHISQFVTGEQTFCHQDGDTKVQTYWAVERLIAQLTANAFQTTKVRVTQEEAQHYLDSRQVEAHRLKRLNGAQVLLPLLYLEDGKHHLLADGVHRYVMSFLSGAPFVVAWVVPERLHKRFKIEGVEVADWDAFLKAPSRVP